MTKATGCIQRKPGMEVEAFQRYWRTRHAEVVVALPGVRRYLRSHALLAGYRKGERIYDGIAEAWLDNLQAMRDLADAPEHAAETADGAEFNVAVTT